MSTNPSLSKTGYVIGLEILDGEYAICRFKPEQPLPPTLNFKGIYSLTRTQRETSLVCRTNEVPDGAKVEWGWRALYVRGPIPFGLTGVVAGITSAVASVTLPVFVLSTYDSDLLFLQSDTFERALDALTAAGYAVVDSSAAEM